jgi:tetratricopeptide (TPR) repeat protein
MAAEVAYQRSIDLAPSSTRGYVNLAQLYLRLDKVPDAVSTYRAALRVDSTNLEIYFGLADLYKGKGEYDRAAGVCKDIMERAPDEPKGYYLAGRLELERGRYDAAVRLLQNAIDLDAGYSEALNALGETYRGEGMEKDARLAFEKAFRSDSSFTLPLRNLGSLSMAQGKENEGIQYYLQAALLGDFDAMSFLRTRGIDWYKR